MSKIENHKVKPWMASWAAATAHSFGCVLHPLENIKLRF
jgi:hypothetical protein